MKVLFLQRQERMEITEDNYTWEPKYGNVLNEHREHEKKGEPK